MWTITASFTHHSPPCPVLAVSPPSSLFIRFRGTFWKCARIGERLSPWVSVACIAMGVNILFFT